MSLLKHYIDLIEGQADDMARFQSAFGGQHPVQQPTQQPAQQPKLSFQILELCMIVQRVTMMRQNAPGFLDILTLAISRRFERNMTVRAVEVMPHLFLNSQTITLECTRIQNCIE